MSIKKSLAIAVSIFLMASGLNAAANPVQNLTKLLTAVRVNNCESSVAVAARAEFIKLNPGQLAHILQAREFDALFVTPYGFSLIHGWMLSYFSHHDLPFYINSKFSFDAYFRSMVEEIKSKCKPTLYQYQVESGAQGTPHAVRAGHQIKLQEWNDFCGKLLSKWDAAKNSIEPNKWAYYKHMQYMHAAIMQAGGVDGQITTMPAIIRSSFVGPVTTSASSTPGHASMATPGKMPQTQTRTWGEWWAGSKTVPANVGGGKDSPGNDHLADHFSHGATGTPVKE